MYLFSISNLALKGRRRQNIAEINFPASTACLIRAYYNKENVKSITKKNSCIATSFSFQQRVNCQLSNTNVCVTALTDGHEV